MSTYRANDNNPTLKKYRQLEDLMNELKISIQVGRYNEMFIVDHEANTTYKIVDNDTNENVDAIPFFYEDKLITED